MKLKINGEEQNIDDAITTIPALLKEFSLQQGQVVVEHNKNIIARDEIDSILLKENDELELIRFMGGG